MQTQRTPIVLVGNKLDLVHERQVARDAAVQLSRSWGGVRRAGSALPLCESVVLGGRELTLASRDGAQVPYYETSARKEINVRVPLSSLPARPTFSFRPASSSQVNFV